MSTASERFAVFGFNSTHDAMRAESALLEQGIEVALIPTPRALGTLCGFAVRVALSARDRARSCMEAARVSPSGEIELVDRVV